MGCFKLGKPEYDTFFICLNIIHVLNNVSLIVYWCDNFNSNSFIHFTCTENYQKWNDYVLNFPFQDENIERFHRIRKTNTNKSTGKKVKSIIVKIKSWKFRQHFYNAGPKYFNNSKQKPGQHLLSVLINLTRR